MSHSKPLTIARIMLTSIFFVDGVALGLWAANIPAIKDGLSLSDSTLGMALSAYAVGAILALLATGWLATKIGTRRTVLIGGCVFAAAAPLPALANSLPLLFVSVFLLGATNSMLDVSMNSHATLVERDWDAEIMSSFHAAYSFGGLAGALLAGFLLQLNYTATDCLLLAMAMMLCTVLVAVGFIGDLRPDAEIAHKKTRILGNVRLYAIGCLAFLALFTEAAMVDWSSVYLKDVAHSSPSFAALGYGAFMFAMAIGRLGGDAAIARLGGGTVFLLGGMLSASGLLLAIIAPQSNFVLVGFVCVGLGLANCIPMLYTRAGAAVPSAPSVGVGLVGTIGYGGFLVGPPLIGAVSSEINLQVGLSLCIGAMLVIALAAGMIRRYDAYPHHAEVVAAR